MMVTVFFIVSQDPSGGFVAKNSRYSIYTEGDTIEQLEANILDAVRCHFGDSCQVMIEFEGQSDEEKEGKVQ